MSNPTPFFLVWNEDGFPPRHKHHSAVSAENEAERLAKANPGKSFIVLAPVTKFTERRVTIERFDLEYELPF